MYIQCLDISWWYQWCSQWHHCIHYIKMIKMRWNVTFWVMWCHCCQYCCHLMLIASSITPFCSLGEDKWKKCYMFLLVLSCCWYQGEHHLTLMALSMAPFWIVRSRWLITRCNMTFSNDFLGHVIPVSVSHHTHGIINGTIAFVSLRYSKWDATCLSGFWSCGYWNQHHAMSMPLSIKTFYSLDQDD